MAWFTWPRLIPKKSAPDGAYAMTAGYKTYVQSGTITRYGTGFNTFTGDGGMWSAGNLGVFGTFNHNPLIMPNSASASLVRLAEVYSVITESDNYAYVVGFSGTSAPASASWTKIELYDASGTLRGTLNRGSVAGTVSGTTRLWTVTLTGYFSAAYIKIS